jgi:hypothetical protein
MDVIPAQLSNRFNQARNRYIQAAKRSADAGDMLFRDPEEDQLRIQEEREYFNMENVFQEICDLANGEDNIIDLFLIRFNDAERIVDDYRAGARADPGVSVQLSNRFNQARDAYIEAAMRRIDAQYVNVNVDEEQIILLEETEEDEYEIFRNIYADIRNSAVNVEPFSRKLSDAEQTVEDYENTAMMRAREREFGGGAPAAGPLFGGGAPAAGPLFGGGAPAAGPLFGGGAEGEEVAPEAEQQCVLQ